MTWVDFSAAIAVDVAAFRLVAVSAPSCVVFNWPTWVEVRAAAKVRARLLAASEVRPDRPLVAMATNCVVVSPLTWVESRLPTAVEFRPPTCAALRAPMKVEVRASALVETIADRVVVFSALICVALSSVDRVG